MKKGATGVDLTCGICSSCDLEEALDIGDLGRHIDEQALRKVIDWGKERCRFLVALVKKSVDEVAAAICAPELPRGEILADLSHVVVSAANVNLAASKIRRSTYSNAVFVHSCSTNCEHWAPADFIVIKFQPIFY